jgi:hypothetical protein
MIKEKLKNNKHAHELAFVKGVQMLKKNRRDSEIDNDEKTTAATEVPNEIHDFGSQLSVGWQMFDHSDKERVIGNELDSLDSTVGVVKWNGKRKVRNSSELYLDVWAEELRNSRLSQQPWNPLQIHSITEVDANRGDSTMMFQDNSNWLICDTNMGQS